MSTETTQTQPTDVMALIEDFLADGGRADDITPQTILGLSDEQVSEIVSGGDEGDIVSAGLHRARRLSHRFLGGSDAAVTTSARRPPVTLHEALGATARERGIKVHLHSGDVYIHRMSAAETLADTSGLLDQRTAPRWVTMLSPSSLTGSIRIGRASHPYDQQESEIHREGWSDVTVDGLLLARIRPRVGQGDLADEGGVIIRLLVNPFLTSSGGLSSARTENRMPVFASILDAAMPIIRQHCWARNEESVADEHLRQSVALIQSIRAMGDQRLQAHDQQARQARHNADAAERRLQQLQQEMIQQARAMEEQRALADSLENQRPERSGEDIIHGLQMIRRIEQLRPVASARVDTVGSGVVMDVRFHPYVLQSRSSQSRHLLTNLQMRIHMSADRPHITWNTGHGYAHPHVSADGSTCLGDATIPVTEAFARRDWMTVVFLMSGWLTQHNPRSEYVRIGQFPAVQTAAGWQVPGESPVAEATPQVVEAAPAEQASAGDDTALAEAA